jgi:hypothetical protein
MIEAQKSAGVCIQAVRKNESSNLASKFLLCIWVFGYRALVKMFAFVQRLEKAFGRPPMR